MVVNAGGEQGVIQQNKDGELCRMMSTHCMEFS